jgi:SAM-dependent methyltransferase
MASNNDQAHWDSIYATKGETDVSWFQEAPTPSLELLDLVGAQPSSAIIDIGGGESRLGGCLLDRGFENLTVLDLSAKALAETRARLGDKAKGVEWIVADVTQWQPSETYDVWHDRAAFHFLTNRSEQVAYIQRLKAALRCGGHAIIGTFVLDGPDKCSRLPVMRHSTESVGTLLGVDFVLIDSRRHEHRTPWGVVQHFQFSTCRRVHKS